MCAVAVIAIAVLIFCFSAQQGEDSAILSRSITAWLLARVYPNFSALNARTRLKLLATVGRTVRKLAHFGEYALLGASVNALIHALRRAKRRWWLLCALAWVPCVLYACTDELHQMFVAGRGPAALDVVIDSCGALIGVLAMELVFTARHRRQKRHRTASGRVQTEIR